MEKTNGTISLRGAGHFKIALRIFSGQPLAHLRYC
jgi:hypothetical protein